jgi:hypothetical protein
MDVQCRGIASRIMGIGQEGVIERWAVIELLVKYIEDKGIYNVEVRPNILVISRTIEDQIVQAVWYILKCDLRPELGKCLQWQADRWCWQIDQAIAERYSCPIAGKR